MTDTPTQPAGLMPGEHYQLIPGMRWITRDGKPVLQHACLLDVMGTNTRDGWVDVPSATE